jgi:hypothetical protein
MEQKTALIKTFPPIFLIIPHPQVFSPHQPAHKSLSKEGFAHLKKPRNAAGGVHQGEEFTHCSPGWRSEGKRRK